ncbi:hypothetical protein D9M68_878410 [compost metagenome]
MLDELFQSADACKKFLAIGWRELPAQDAEFEPVIDQSGGGAGECRGVFPALQRRIDLAAGPERGCRDQPQAEQGDDDKQAEFFLPGQEYLHGRLLAPFPVIATKVGQS